MKKFLAMLMAAFLFTSVVGCGDKKDDKKKEPEKKAADKDAKPS